MTKNELYTLKTACVLLYSFNNPLYKFVGLKLQKMVKKYDNRPIYRHPKK